MIKCYLYILSLSIYLTGFSFCPIKDQFIDFDKSNLSYKKTLEGDTIQLEYTFVYIGNDTLSILPPEVDCSCTSIELPSSPITSSTTYSIKVHFDTHGKIGYQDRTFTVNFIGSNGQTIYSEELRFKGMIKASKKTKELYKRNK